MSVFLKPMGYLAAFAATAGVTGCDPAINGQGTTVAAPVKGEQPTPLPRPPIKIPMPLDKAGGKVDVTFEVPPPPKGAAAWSYFAGLRVLFTPGTDEVFQILEEHPISARVFLSRIQDGEEIPIPLFSRTRRPPPGRSPHRVGDAFELPDGEAIAVLHYAQHTSDPPGTPNASTFVMSFASAHYSGRPGIYRLQVETLEDIPELSGVTSFFVYEQHPKR